MFRSNTVEDVQQTGLVRVDAGEGVELSIQVEPSADVDTGLRKITDAVSNRTAGNIYLRRTGSMVFLQFTGLKYSSQSTYPPTNLPILPDGFRPALNIIDPTPLHVVESEPQYAGDPEVLVFPRTIVGTNGTVRFFGSDPALPIYFTCAFMTSDPAPEELPGAAV